MNINHIHLKDNEVIDFIDNINLSYKKLQNFSFSDFENKWRDWLQSSSYNKCSLDTMKHCGFTSGTTQSFSEFVARYNQCRIRVSRSDFVLTKILCNQYNVSWKYIEESPLESNDALIISLPFSGNGSIYPEYDNLLDICDELDIPVFIDAAYFGISHGVTYDLKRPCIKDFSTSITKTFGCETIRSGVRFTKQLVDDAVTAPLLGPGLFDRVNAYITMQLLENFSHDKFISKYIDKSNNICKKYDLTSTNTITLAIINDSQYLRGDYNRVCITEYLS
jgi:hypothetical protein